MRSTLSEKNIIMVTSILCSVIVERETLNELLMYPSCLYFQIINDFIRLHGSCRLESVLFLLGQGLNEPFTLQCCLFQLPSFLEPSIH